MYQYILTLAADGECLQFLLDHNVVGAIIKMMTKLSSHSAAQQVRPSVALQLSLCFPLLFVFSAPSSPFTPPPSPLPSRPFLLPLHPSPFTPRPSSLPSRPFMLSLLPHYITFQLQFRTPFASSRINSPLLLLPLFPVRLGVRHF